MRTHTHTARTGSNTDAQTQTLSSLCRRRASAHTGGLLSHRVSQIILRPKPNQVRCGARKTGMRRRRRRRKTNDDTEGKQEKKGLKMQKKEPKKTESERRQKASGAAEGREGGRGAGRLKMEGLKLKDEK